MKLEINVGNQHVMFLVLFVVALFIVGIAGAYNNPPTGGTPSAMGHSSDEVMVNDAYGNMKLLQEAINDGSIVKTVKTMAEPVSNYCAVAGCDVTATCPGAGKTVAAESTYFATGRTNCNTGYYVPREWTKRFDCIGSTSCTESRGTTFPQCINIWCA